MTIEIVSFPINSMVDRSIVFWYVYQRVYWGFHKWKIPIIPLIVIY